MRFPIRLLFLSSVMYLSIPLFAQNASVSGEVVDPQHAGIKGSEVTLSNTSTRVKVETVTNGRGEFLLPRSLQEPTRSRLRPQGLERLR